MSWMPLSRAHKIKSICSGSAHKIHFSQLRFRYLPDAICKIYAKCVSRDMLIKRYWDMPSKAFVRFYIIVNFATRCQQWGKSFRPGITSVLLHILSCGDPHFGKGFNKRHNINFFLDWRDHGFWWSECVLSYWWWHARCLRGRSKRHSD